MTDPKDRPVRITNFFDADNNHDIDTRQSINGALIILNNNQTQWYNQRKKDVDTLTYE